MARKKRNTGDGSNRGTIKGLPVCNLQRPNDGFTGSPMCPYTPFIPIEYLYYNDKAISNVSPVTEFSILDRCFSVINGTLSINDRELVGKAKLQSLKNDVLSNLMLASRSISNTYTEMVSYLAFDTPCKAGCFGRHSINNTAEMAEAFCRGEGLTFELRTFSGLLGSYSLAARGGTTDTALSYSILAVITPENLYYQRLHILATGEIDLSHVIFLVDEQLEEEDFPIRGLRTFYLGRLKDMLEATTGQIHLVPKQVIKNACFLQPFALPRALDERRAVVASIGDMFRAYVGTNTIQMSLLYKKPKSAKPLGPLVPAVEPTTLVEERFAQLAPQQREPNVRQPGGVSSQPPAHNLDGIREEMLADTMPNPDEVREWVMGARVVQGTTIVAPEDHLPF